MAASPARSGRKAGRLSVSAAFAETLQALGASPRLTEKLHAATREPSGSKASSPGAATGRQPHQDESVAQELGSQALGLSRRAVASAEAGDLPRAMVLIDGAETIAGTIAAPGHRAEAMAGVAQALIAAGDLDRAETVAHKVKEPYHRVLALSSLAEVLTATGDRDRAVALLTRAETVARAIEDPDRRAWALTGLTAALATAGAAGSGAVPGSLDETVTGPSSDRDRTERPQDLPRPPVPSSAGPGTGAKTPGTPRPGDRPQDSRPATPADRSTARNRIDT